MKFKFQCPLIVQLEDNHVSLFMYHIIYGCCLIKMEKITYYMRQRLHGLQSLKYLLSGPLLKRFAYSCPKLICQDSKIGTRAAPVKQMLKDMQGSIPIVWDHHWSEHFGILLIELSSLRRWVGWTCNLEALGLGFAAEGSRAQKMQNRGVLEIFPHSNHALLRTTKYVTWSGHSRTTFRQKRNLSSN